MKPFLFALLSSVFILMSCTCSGPQAPPPTPLPQQQIGVSERDYQKQLMTYFTERTVSVSIDCTAKKGVVFFDVRNPNRLLDGRGTGVIKKSKEKRSYIYTAAHVVVMEEKYKKYFTCKVYVNRNENLGNKSTRIEAEIVAANDDRDVAVLSVERDLGISTEDEKDTFVGESVWAVGYPVQLVSRKTKKLSITEGSLATLKVPASGNVSTEGYYHRVTSQIYFGNSGGGIWNIEGKLVGIASSMYTRGGVPYEGYYYIKPVNEFEIVLKDTWKYWEVFNE